MRDLDFGSTLFGPRQDTNEWWAGDELLQWLPNGSNVLDRTTTDAPTTSDAATRAAVLSRTTADAPHTSDTAVAIVSGGAVNRTTTDAPHTSDIATRVSTLPRATTDAPHTSDVQTRTVVLSRATTDAPHTSDVATRVASLHKTTTDAPHTSDAAVQLKTISRTTADSPTTSDVQTRLVVLHRTTTDAPHTSDVATASVVGGGTNRTTTDAPTTSDAASRVLGAARTVFESPFISDLAVVAVNSVVAIASESVTAGNEALRNGVFTRTATEAVSASLSATKVTSRSRTVSQTLTASLTATRSQVVARSATDRAHINESVFQPDAPPVMILIGGVNYANNVLFSSARFLTQVNGVPGDFYLRLRDPLRTISIPTGTEIALVIEGYVVWRGFAQMVQRVYVFPAMDVDAFGETRFLDLTGPDINVLFTKRFVFNQSAPQTVQGTLYPPFQPDQPVIADLVTNWLDLSGDPIDTSAFVDHVGDITNTQEGTAYFAGDTWGRAMQSIASLPAAIYYLRPTAAGADLVYCDVDTPNAPYAMSDIAVASSSLTDNFGRTVASNSSGWGTGDLGLWHQVVGGSPTTYSVTPGSAVMQRQGWQYTSVTASTFPIVQTTHWTWPAATGSDAASIGLDFGGVPGVFSGDDWVELSLDENGFFELFTNTDDDFTTLVSPAPGQAWAMSLRVNADGSSQAKAWQTSTAEPGWQLFNGAGTFNVSALSSQDVFANSSNVTDLWHFSSVSIEGTPSATPTVGYREMSIDFDGAGLINDELAWGIGYGSNTPVFVRDQDAASQTEHGLWQGSTTAYGVYKQGTIDRIAASIVDGSPQSKRGAKNDRKSVVLTTYQRGFLPSQKIDFTSEVWGFSDVIPIRKMEVTFEAPDHPKYRLTLSHEIDAPFGFFDPFLFNFPPFPQPDLPPGVQPPTLPGLCTPGFCGITDDFTRTVASGLGTATCGYPWVTSVLASGSTVSVDGTAAVLHGSSATSGQKIGLTIDVTDQPFEEAAVRTLHFQLPNYDTSWDTTFIWRPSNQPGVPFGPALFIRESASWLTWVNGAGTVIPAGFWNSGTTYTWTHERISGTTTRVTVSNGATSYSADSGTDPTLAQCSVSVNVQAGSTAPTIRILDIDIPEITRCTLNKFDLFNRVVAPSDWGTSTDGHVWEEHGDGEIYVDFGAGVLRAFVSISGHLTPEARVTSPGPWNLDTYTMTFAFTLEDAPTAGHVTLMHFGQVEMQSSTVSGDTNSYLKAAGGDNVAVDPAFWVSGGHYTVDYVVVSNIATATLSDGANTYVATASDGGGSSFLSMRIQAFILTGEQLVTFDYINFDYAGKPCYMTVCFDGADGLIDDYNRFVTDGLGTASIGTAYTNYGGDEASFQVVGSHATVDCTIGFSTWANHTVFADLVYSTPLSYGMAIKIGFSEDGSSWGITNASDAVVSLAGKVTFGPSFSYVALSVDKRSTSGSIHTDMSLDLRVHGVFATGQILTDHPPIPGHLYEVKVVRTVDQSWYAEVPELGMRTSTIASPGFTTTTAFRVEADMGFTTQQPAFVGARPLVLFDDLQAATLCGVGGGPGSLQMNPNGFGCELPARVDSTTYQCTNVIVAGTSRVYVDGLLQRPGATREYTEATAASGTIVFNDPVPSSSVVTVCYFGAGALGGTP